MQPAKRVDLPAEFEAFTSTESRASSDEAMVAADLLVWPPPQADIDSIEVVELRFDELSNAAMPRRELAVLPPAASANQPGVATAPPGRRPDLHRLNAQIRDLLALIGRRPQDHPEAFIPVPAALESSLSADSR